jgi:GNAT superfamily N-acetyltransferase
MADCASHARLDSPTMSIDIVGKGDLDDLLPLVQAYCRFYEVDPPRERLIELSLSLIERPEEGSQLIARGEDGGEPLGFATVYWTWDTLRAARVGVMHDLFVKPESRGRGVADALIEACRRLAHERGAAGIGWQTATDNLRAQRVYGRVGAKREQWVDYWLRAS